MSLEECRLIGDNSEERSSNKESFRIHDLYGKMDKKGTLELLNQIERLRGDILVFKCIKRCFKDRSNGFFFLYTYCGLDRNSEFQLQ